MRRPGHAEKAYALTALDIAAITTLAGLGRPIPPVLADIAIALLGGALGLSMPARRE